VLAGYTRCEYCSISPAGEVGGGFCLVGTKCSTSEQTSRAGNKQSFNRVMKCHFSYCIDPDDRTLSVWHRQDHDHGYWYTIRCFPGQICVYDGHARIARMDISNHHGTEHLPRLTYATGVLQSTCRTVSRITAEPHVDHPHGEWFQCNKGHAREHSIHDLLLEVTARDVVTGNGILISGEIPWWLDPKHRPHH